MDIFHINLLLLKLHYLFQRDTGTKTKKRPEMAHFEENKLKIIIRVVE